MFFAERVKAAIESLLFVSNEPLTVKQISELVNIEQREALSLIENLIEEYNQDFHGICLKKIADGYQFTTKPEYFTFLEKLYKPRLSTLSHAALETLSIVAYKQPITRSEIELIRGVKVEKTLTTLIEKNLIEESGRKEGPGRPILYGTTKDFLKHFGLENIKQLPPLTF